MPTLDVELRLGAHEYIKNYRVPDAQVFARSRDGRRVQFPANILQRFVDHSGVHGWFRLEFDASGRLLGIERL
jgi:hypothetical protein